MCKPAALAATLLQPWDLLVGRASGVIGHALLTADMRAAVELPLLAVRHGMINAAAPSDEATHEWLAALWAPLEAGPSFVLWAPAHLVSISSLGQCADSSQSSIGTQEILLSRCP